jgi:hypothetical protein
LRAKKGALFSHFSFENADILGMSIASHDLRLLEHLMREEAETLEALSVLEDGLRRSVLARDWSGLDETLRSVKAAGEKVWQADQIRAAVYRKIQISCQLGPEAGFQDVLACVPVEEREGLNSLHRRLRVAAERVRCLTGGLDTYISSAVSTMDKVLEEVLPERKNRIYNSGGRIEGSSRPVMISRSL